MISQTLLKTKDGSGRVAAHEIMLGHLGHPQPDPREQDRADVLGDPDRQAPRHDHARPEPGRPGAPQRVSPAEARNKAKFPENFPGPGRQQERHGHGTRPGIQVRQRPAALMVSRNGSDLFLTADFPPAIKVDGKITKVSPQPLTGPHTR